MRRLAALAMIVTACGGSPAAETTVAPTTPAVSTTAGETTTTVPGATTTTAAVTPTTARVLPEGDPAPGFTVELGEGGTFTLSEHARPVYLLFWAEW
jgi:hypothetical protein